ncbi:PHP domain-containing protein [Actinoplanes solisilvae]|uniref:PHP domain-containing protein n=1 Tax=Actinoplanes solisilvae TaxID=2486853 RepID=UPI0013E28A9B|nr:PHP domain-containing protein [Actinoplanes solisilvae]
MADLHLHSVHSDGTESPAEVMRCAFAHGVRTAALTDHDRISGWSEAAGAALGLGMTFLPGMELSMKTELRTLHMLAYLFDPDNAPLRAEADRIRRDRVERAQRMVRRIGKDHHIRWDDVISAAPEGATIGRPHIADALVARGIVSTRGEAFTEILDPGSRYYEPLYAPDPLTAVRLITNAGGVAIAAHPVTSGPESFLSRKEIDELIEAGLGGFEIDHRDNTPDGKAMLQAIADEHDLIVTGASDYHGDGKPNVPGENSTTQEMIARIIERATGTAPRFPDARNIVQRSDDRA